jgi:hypothetical protein
VIEEWCRLTSEANPDKRGKIRIIRAQYMLDYQFVIIEFYQSPKRKKLGLEMTEQFEKAGESVPDMFPLEMVEICKPFLKTRYLVCDSASALAEDERIDLTREDTS